MHRRTETRVCTLLHVIHFLVTIEFTFSEEFQGCPVNIPNGNIEETCTVGLIIGTFKAAWSVTFDLLIFEIMFLFFKNTVKKLKFRYTFHQFRKSLQIISIKTTAFMLNLTVYNYWRDANNYQQEKKHLFLSNNSLFHAVFSYGEQIYFKNLS